MKNLKIGVLAFGVLGLISMFIPMEGFTMFAMLKAIGVKYLAPVLLGFIVPTVVGAMALKGTLKKPAAIAAIAGFALVFVRMEMWHFGDLFKGPFGTKLFALAVIGGLVVSIAATVKAEE